MAGAGLSGLTANSFQNLQLDAGVFIENFDYSGILTLDALITATVAAIDTNSCLGATSGGMTWSSTPEFHTIELDGTRQDFKGSQIKDKAAVTIETTLAEVTPENLRRILCSSDVEITGDIVKVRERLNIDMNQDYIDSLTWIGDINDGRCALITLFNCININGATWTAADKSNATFPVTFVATASDFADRNYAPYELLIFEKPSAVAEDTE